MLYVVLQDGSMCRPKQEDTNNPNDLTIDVSDFVAHGKPDELIIFIVQDKDLVHAEHLSWFHVSQRLAILAALEGDGLTPLVRPGVSGAIGQSHFVVPSGG